MTILPAKRPNASNNEETEENTHNQSNQQKPMGLNISSSRLNHNTLQLGHGQLLKHQETNERQHWTRHEDLQHSRPQHSHSNKHSQHTNFEEAPSSSKRRNYAYNSIPNTKDRYYRNLERKRIREQNKERERARDLEQKIECDRNLELINSQSTSPIQNASTLSSDSDAQQREDATGYNSEDEYSEHPSKQLTEEEWRKRDMIFARSLEKRGFVIKPMVEDGACLFRAIADQVYGDQEMHSVVRTHCMDYILKNRDFYCAYVTEDFNKYVSRKRHDFVHGNHLEIQALSEMYHRSIEVYCYQLKPINIFHGAQKSDYEPIRLSYQRASHYNSITNPFNPSVGVGLGLPSYVLPSDIDRRQVNDAVRQSEESIIEQTMMEDKLKATDWEATNEVIEEQVARESYLQWCKDNEKRRKQQAHCSSSSSSSTVTSAACCTNSPRSSSAGPRSPRPRAPVSPHSSQGSSRTPVRSPKPQNLKNSPIPEEHTAPSSSETTEKLESQSEVFGENFCETDTIFSRLPPEVFGLTDWEDAGVMARVLAASQQEYLDNLKAAARNQHQNSPGPSTSR